MDFKKILKLNIWDVLNYISKNIKIYYFIPENMLYKTCDFNSLLQNKKGHILDVIELLRYYSKINNVEFYSFYIEATNKNRTYYKLFFVFKFKNNYYYIDNLLSIENVENKFFSFDKLKSSYYKKFQNEVRNKFNESFDFYFDSYNLISKEKKVAVYTILKPKSNYMDMRHEFSSMSIVFCKDKVLCMKTTEKKYVLPKGHIEKDEDVIGTAIRECKEETGIDINRDNYLFKLKPHFYTFCGSCYKFLTNTDFYNIFETYKIIKKIFVNVFYIDNFQKTVITEPENFTEVTWMNINDFSKKASYRHDKINVLMAYKKIKEMNKK